VQRYKLFAGVAFVLFILTAAFTTTALAYDHNREENVGPCTGRSDNPHYSQPSQDLSAHGYTYCQDQQNRDYLWVNTGLWKWTINGNNQLTTGVKDGENTSYVNGNARRFCENGNYFTMANHLVIDGLDEWDATTSSLNDPTWNTPTYVVCDP
jgi:hypothetical protein